MKNVLRSGERGISWNSLSISSSAIWAARLLWLKSLSIMNIRRLLVFGPAFAKVILRCSCTNTAKKIPFIFSYGTFWIRNSYYNMYSPSACQLFATFSCYVKALFLFTPYSCSVWCRTTLRIVLVYERNTIQIKGNFMFLEFTISRYLGLHVSCDITWQFFIFLSQDALSLSRIIRIAESV